MSEVPHTDAALTAIFLVDLGFPGGPWLARSPFDFPPTYIVQNAHPLVTRPWLVKLSQVAWTWTIETSVVDAAESKT